MICHILFILERSTTQQQKICCEKCNEEDTLKEKLESLRELTKKMEVESMNRATSLSKLKTDIKILQDNMCIFTSLSRKTMCHAKEANIFAKKYSRKSAASCLLKSFNVTKSAFHAKIIFCYAKRCDRFANNAIAVMTTNQVEVSISGQQDDKM